MKLPKELEIMPGLKLFSMTALDLIVRDCATAAAKAADERDATVDTSDYVHAAVLARYGLKEK